MSMPRDLVCVYYAASIGEADILAAWLDEQGIPAVVKNPLAVTTLQTPLIAAPRGVEVCVEDQAQAERARLLLVEHLQSVHREPDPATSNAQVTATCEECGRSAEFPIAQRGSVQTCPHCDAYVDVPGE